MKKGLITLLTIVVILFSFSVPAFAGGGPIDPENCEQSNYLEQQKMYNEYNEGVIASVFKNYVIKNFKPESNSTVEDAILVLIKRTPDAEDICNLLKVYQGNEYFKQVFKLSQNVSCGTRYQIISNKMYIFYSDATIGVIEGNMDIPLGIISNYTGLANENWQNNVNILYKDDQVVIFEAGSLG